jgi:hypothetical protein
VGEFKLQVGDVIRMRGNSWKWKFKALLFTTDGDPIVLLKRGRTQAKMVYQSAIEGFGTVHRPTPSGLVQVWPEVKGA